MKILGENGIGKFLKVFLQICFWGGIVLLIALPLIAQIAKVHLNASIYVIYPNWNSFASYSKTVYRAI